MAPKMAAAGPFDIPDVQLEAEMATGHEDTVILKSLDKDSGIQTKALENGPCHQNDLARGLMTPCFHAHATTSAHSLWLGS